MTECDVSAGRQESQDDASRLELLLEALVSGQLGAAIVEAARLATLEHLGQEALGGSVQLRGGGLGGP